MTEACRPPSSLQLEQVGFIASVDFGSWGGKGSFGGWCVCVSVRERERGRNKGMEVAELKGPSWGRRQGEWASQGEVVQRGVGLVGVTEPGEGV